MSGRDWFGYSSMGPAAGDQTRRGVRQRGGGGGGGVRNIRAPSPRRRAPPEPEPMPMPDPRTFVPGPAAVLGNMYMESHGKGSPRRSPRPRSSPRRASPSRHHNGDVSDFLARAGEKASMEEIAWEVQQLNNFLSRAGMTQPASPPRPGLRGRVHIPPAPEPPRHSPLHEGFSAWAEEARSSSERRRHVLEAGVELLESRARRRIQLAAFKTWQSQVVLRNHWRYEERQLQRQRAVAAQRRRHSLMSAYQRWIGYAAGAQAGSSPLVRSKRQSLGPGRRHRAVARKRFGSGMDSSSEDGRDDLEDYWRSQRLLTRLTPQEQSRLRAQFGSSSSEDEEDNVRWARRRAGLSDASVIKLDSRRSERASQILTGHSLRAAGRGGARSKSPSGSAAAVRARGESTARDSSARLRLRSPSRSPSPPPPTPAATPLRRFRAAASADDYNATGGRGGGGRRREADHGATAAARSTAESDRAWRIMYGADRSTRKKAQQKRKEAKEVAEARVRWRREQSPTRHRHVAEEDADTAAEAGRGGSSSSRRQWSPRDNDSSSSDESLADSMAFSPRGHRSSSPTGGWHAMSLNDEQSTRAMKILFTPGGRRMASASTDDAGAAGLDTPRTALERQRLGLRKKREALRQAQQRTPALGLGANE
jgi:hypothetical protein